jgi:outer membrane protein OmpA-like peptidoglycan-associated protein
MSRFATPGRQPTEKRAHGRRFGRVRAVAGAPILTSVLAATLALTLTSPSAAQSNSGIFINNDVLNNLGPGPQAAPLTPMPAPVLPNTPRGAAPTLIAPSAPSGGSNGLSFQTHGSGNFVVTRPGTLLFPPLEAPTSTLAPGFDSGANQAAREEAYNNAFAEGPEPTSQLLIPLASEDDGSSIQVFTDRLPPADPNARQGSAPVLTLRLAPQPAPPKPAVPEQAIAEAQRIPTQDDATELAPEFKAAEAEIARTQDTQPESPEPPVMAEMPAVEKVEQVAIAPSPTAAPSPAAAPSAPAAEVTEAALSDGPATAPEAAAAEVPAPQTATAPAPVTAPAENAMPDSSTPATSAPAASAPIGSAPTGSAPVSSAEVAAPVTPQEPTETVVASEPVNLLPAGTSEASAASTSGETAAPQTGGLQTASLTVGTPAEDMTFLFDGESAELSEQAQSELRSLADSLRGNGESRVQVLGFASADGSSADMARKLALSRALKVRSFLINAGVPSTRIQVRSLGDKSEGGPANRVDIRPIDS